MSFILPKKLISLGGRSPHGTCWFVCQLASSKIWTCNTLALTLLFHWTILAYCVGSRNWTYDIESPIMYSKLLCVTLYKTHYNTISRSTTEPSPHIMWYTITKKYSAETTFATVYHCLTYNYIHDSFKGIGATDWIWTNTPSKMTTQRLAISCLTIRLTVAERSFYA